MADRAAAARAPALPQPPRWEQPTALTLTVSKSVVPYNGAVVLTGGMSSNGTTLTEPLQVTLFKRTHGVATVWMRDCTATLSPAGTFTATRTLGATTSFRLHFDGTTTLSAGASPEAVVEARAVLSRPMVPSRIVRGRYFIVHGYLKPRHGSYTKLRFCRRSGGRWQPYATLRARDSNLAPFTAWSLRLKLSSRGRYYVQAYHSDIDHGATWSTPRLFTVR